MCKHCVVIVSDRDDDVYASFDYLDDNVNRVRDNDRTLTTTSTVRGNNPTTSTVRGNNPTT
jgi:hypothetical protein